MYIREFNSPLPFSLSFFFMQCLVPDSTPALLTTPSPPWRNLLYASPSFSFLCLLCPEAPNRRPSTQLSKLPHLTQCNTVASLTTQYNSPAALSAQHKIIRWPYLPLLLGAPCIASANPHSTDDNQVQIEPGPPLAILFQCYRHPLSLRLLSHHGGCAPFYHHILRLVPTDQYPDVWMNCNLSSAYPPRSPRGSSNYHAGLHNCIY
jgi:hypothetical protein